MSFDTEGGGQLLDNHGSKKRLFVAYATPKSHTILMLHDANDTPDSIGLILADYTVAKIQSGVGGDVALMRELGLGVQGVVDSGTLFMLVKPGTIVQGFGTKH
jgi:hypothetical protein